MHVNASQSSDKTPEDELQDDAVTEPSPEETTADAPLASDSLPAKEAAGGESEADASDAPEVAEPDDSAAEAAPESDAPAAEEAEEEAPKASKPRARRKPKKDDDDDVQPLVEYADEEEEEEASEPQWYILKVQSNREDSIRDALWRRIKMYGLERFVHDIVVPTEDVAEFNKSGKRRIVKRKLFQGYIMVHMVINDDTWFAIRETPGVGDFTGAAGKPTPMEAAEVARYIKTGQEEDEEEAPIKTAIPFKTGDRVRVKEGYFQNFEGDVEAVDETHGRVTVMINIFGRPTPVELEHWQMESV